MTPNERPAMPPRSAETPSARVDRRQRLSGALTAAERIRQARRDLGLSQRQVAAAASNRLGRTLSRSALAQAELGKRGIHVDELLALAEAFGVPASRLLGEDPCPRCATDAARRRATELRAQAERIEREAGL